MSDELRERLEGVERDVRAQLYQVNREVAAERAITRDLVEALHIRVDRFEDTVMGELRTIKTLIASNGHG